MLTDILHAFAQNPTHPVYDDSWQPPACQPNSTGFADVASGIHPIGHDDEGFFFDNEGPQHRVFLQPARVARNLVTNAEWLDFMAGRRLCDADALAVGRLGNGAERKAGRRRAIGRRSTASGSR